MSFSLLSDHTFLFQISLFLLYGCTKRQKAWSAVFSSQKLLADQKPDADEADSTLPVMDICLVVLLLHYKWKPFSMFTKIVRYQFRNWFQGYTYKLINILPTK